MENSTEPERVTFVAEQADVERARALAALMNLSFDEYLRRALRIVNAETAAFLSTRRN